MRETHYTILGIKNEATPAEIRAAYRRLVLEHHPDRAGPDANLEVFHRISKAHEVLSDPERRASYDRLLAGRTATRASQPPPAAKKPAPEPRPAAKEPPKPSVADMRRQIADDLSRLLRLYGRGNFVDAEALARQIVLKDPRQAVPYAILGDLARNRGDIAEASKMYAFAAQIDPRNPAYQRKHEELIGKVSGSSIGGRTATGEAPLAAGVSFALVLVGAAYVALANEPAAFIRLAWVSTWTLGLVVMLFLTGVAMGVGLSMGNLMDRFDSLASNAMNRVSPALALATIAVVNFWFALLLYLAVGARERSHSQSVNRLFVGVGVVVVMMSAACFGADRIDPLQTFLWGGNLAYVGAVCGWLVADSLRDTA